MTQNKGRQKQLEKKRKKRQLAQKGARHTGRTSSQDMRDVLRAALGMPVDAVFISDGWDDESEPKLVSIIVSRRMLGDIMAVVALVDRTCLGVKSGFLAPPMSPAEFDVMLDQMSEMHDGEVQECSLLLAQSIIFHALDYAHSLGFKPDVDFPVALIGPRPETLLDTPWAHPAKPFYTQGPHDNVSQVLRTLDASVGSGNYDYLSVIGESMSPGGWSDDIEDEDEEEDK
jgi:hypothetical protein